MPEFKDTSNPAFEEVQGPMELQPTNPDHNKLFNDAMTCDAKAVVPAQIKSCKGFETIANVGGGNGILLRLFVEACPWIRGINFDLLHVVSVSPKCDHVENVADDMFDCVPKADAVITKVCFKTTSIYIFICDH